MPLSAEEEEIAIESIRKELTDLYNVLPMSRRDAWKYRIFESALFKCIDSGQGIARAKNGIEKRMIADLVREHPVEDIFAIFDMGKLAKAENEEAVLDLSNWYSGSKLYHGLMTGGCRKQAEGILQKYRTGY
jgi:hypothetical protein